MADICCCSALPFQGAGKRERQCPESGPGSLDWAPGLSVSPAARYGPYQSRHESWKAVAVVHTLPACVTRLCRRGVTWSPLSGFGACVFHLGPVSCHTLLPGKGWPLIRLVFHKVHLAFHEVPPPIGTLCSKWNPRASFPVSLCLYANWTPNPVAHSHETGL